MVAECQLSLKHLFPANNSLCRCLVLAEGSPIASSLLTQNNNADECHLLVMFFSIVSQAQCFLYRESIYGAAITAYVTGAAAIGRGMYSSCRFLCWQPCCVMCWMVLGLAADGLTVPNPALSVAAACSARTAVWNVGRVAAKVEVTSSRSFLFIFLFPEFHCYYSNNRWSKLSPLCFHSGPVTNVNFRNICRPKTKICKCFFFLLLLLLVVYFCPSCVVQSPTVFLSVYLDFISMMPIEPPGNNWLSARFKLIALSLACRDQYWY